MYGSYVYQNDFLTIFSNKKASRTFGIFSLTFNRKNNGCLIRLIFPWTTDVINFPLISN